MAVKYKLGGDNIPAIIRAKLDQLKREKLADAVGAAVRNEVRQHLFDYNKSHPNSLGGKRTNYYAQAAKSTSYQVVPGGVVVQVAWPGINLQYYGGVVRPGVNPSSYSGNPTKYLTIPAIAQAHGRRAVDFDNLKFVKFGKGPNAPAALVEAPQAAFKSGNKKVPGLKKFQKASGYKARVFFWLVRSVTIKENKEIIPSDERINSVITGALNKIAG